MAEATKDKETKEKDKKATTTSTATKKVQPPEGFIPIDKIIEKEPDFAKKYRGREDVYMAIWIDEPVPSKAIIMSEYDHHNSKATFKYIPVREPYTIKVTDFLHLYGAPQLELWRDSKPKDLRWADTKWRQFQRQKLHLWRREIQMKPKQKHDPRTGLMLDKTSYHRDTVDDATNDKYGYWGHLPKVYILMPDRLSYTIRPEMDILEYVWQAMNESGVNTYKSEYEEEDIKAVYNALLSRSNEYGIDDLLSSSVSLAVVAGYMTAAKEKYSTA